MKHKIKFVVPQGNGYTLPTIQTRVMPHLVDLGHGWELFTTGIERDYELRTSHALNSVEMQVAKSVLERHYGFKVYEMANRYDD